MKRTQLLRTTIFAFLLISGSTFAQRVTTPNGYDTIQCTIDPTGENLYEFIQLTNLPSGAKNSHLWWSGDNDFTFVQSPNHTYTRNPTGAPYQVKMTDVVTENYGNGGPPPLTYTYYTSGGSKSPKIALPAGDGIYMQSYRNAVINDTMYLIVTYKNTSQRVVNGSLKFNVGNNAHIIDDMFDPTSHAHFLSNREQWNAANDICTFQQLKPGVEQSILIPVFIDPNEEDQLEMRVDFYHNGIDKADQVPGQNFYSITADVAHSHDPNLMLEASDARNQCDYRNGTIHYTTKFQNTGDAPTYYVRVECFLDDKVDMDAISGIKVPSVYSSNFDRTESLNSHLANRGAIVEIDKPNRKIIFEMHDLKLQGTGDPNLVNLEMSRDQVEFDIKMKSNYIFGPAAIAYAKIYFDKNPPIQTDTAKTICGDPVSEANGGGFQNTSPSFWDKWKWIIISGFALVVAVIVGRRMLGKRG